MLINQLDHIKIKSRNKPSAHKSLISNMNIKQHVVYFFMKNRLKLLISKKINT